MYFKEDSQIIQDYILLLKEEEITIKEIPEFLGLRKAVDEAYEEYKRNLRTS